MCVSKTCHILHLPFRACRHFQAKELHLQPFIRSMMSGLSEEAKANPFSPALAEKDQMYNFLGQTGLKVSNVGVGTMTFGKSHLGHPGQVDEKLCVRILNRYLELGGNLIDTSNLYGEGETEAMIGAWLTTVDRNKVVLASKVRFMTDRTNPNAVGLSRKSIMWNIETSLKRLQTDHLDIYQIHCWDAGTKVEEVLRTMDDLVRSGKVRYIGACNVTGWQLQKMADYSKFLGLNPLVSLQMQYNLLNREVELEHADVCRNEGIGMLCWSPLKGGLLTGKVSRESGAPEGSRVKFTESNPAIDWESHPKMSVYREDDRVWKLLELMRQIAAEHNKSVSQVALRWAIQKDFVSSVIMGVKTLEQLESNMGAAYGWQLTDSQIEALDAASSRPGFYPYAFVKKHNADRTRSSWCK